MKKTICRITPWLVLWGGLCIAVSPGAGGTPPTTMPGVHKSSAFVKIPQKELAVRFLDVNTGEVVRQVPAGGLGSYFTCFSPDGKLLAVGFVGRVRVYETTDWKMLWEKPTEGTARVTFSPDSRKLGWQDWTGTPIHIGSSVSGKEIRALPIEPKSECLITFSPDGKLFLAGRCWRSPQVIIWDANTWDRVETIDCEPSGGAGHILSLAVSPDSTRLAIARHITVRGSNSSGPTTRDSALSYRSWRVVELGLLRGEHNWVKVNKKYHRRDGVQVCFTPDGSSLIVGGSGNPYSFHHPTSGKAVKSPNFPRGNWMPPNSITGPFCLSPDGNLLCVIEYGRLYLFETATGRKIRIWKFGKFCPGEPCFSPDGKILVVPEAQPIPW